MPARIILDCGHEPAPFNAQTQALHLQPFGIGPDGVKLCFNCCHRYDIRRIKAGEELNLFLENTGSGPVLVNAIHSLRLGLDDFQEYITSSNRKTHRLTFTYGPYRWYGRTLKDNVVRCRRYKSN